MRSYTPDSMNSMASPFTFMDMMTNHRQSLSTHEGILKFIYFVPRPMAFGRILIQCTYFLCFFYRFSETKTKSQIFPNWTHFHDTWSSVHPLENVLTSLRQLYLV